MSKNKTLLAYIIAGFIAFYAYRMIQARRAQG